MKFSPILVENYFEWFINRADLYFQQWSSENSYGYKTMREPVTLDVIDAHVSGSITIGIPALSGEHCKWCCWDSDVEDGRLDKLQQVLVRHDWRVVREGRRTGKDGHLWMFFDQPVIAKNLILLSKVFERTAEIASGSMEFFPKQSSTQNIGSLLRGPLGIHHKPGAEAVRGWFEGVERDVAAQLGWLWQQEKNSASSVRELSKELHLRQPILRVEQSRRGYRGKGDSKNILDLIPHHARTLRGSHWVRRCYACAEMGWDTHEDNLQIDLDGTKFCCVEGGPGKVHKRADIYAALYRTMTTK